MVLTVAPRYLLLLDISRTDVYHGNVMVLYSVYREDCIHTWKVRKCRDKATSPNIEGLLVLQYCRCSQNLTNNNLLNVALESEIVEYVVTFLNSCMYMRQWSPMIPRYAFSRS